jgi:hypothetical protein
MERSPSPPRLFLLIALPWRFPDRWEHEIQEGFLPSLRRTLEWHSHPAALVARERQEQRNEDEYSLEAVRSSERAAMEELVVALAVGQFSSDVEVWAMSDGS